ncbi:hypothetical protein M406DRAFT_73655 [Cryphonectria parasitica EP155]|uniref:Wax synthase domain-containing protein n=1 Tax=Cryphonectria parasitica (strain ATCC 38755 / EP155) TaxID=660469 RepID=A0A9P5CME2_CRYP1|nr:uncharacterized protein M406DRAFT_73655 [Cryphonectria parasitica EP155]KAF3762996.1 hypothetical protein M406DRAFT_73655 [Cryphonectria parasitica EP155]
MICPPLVYYLALLLLPPPPPPALDTFAIKALRNALALSAAWLFLRLPLAYHVPQSIGLTYQLGLVGLYGSARVVDVFFISPYLLGHIPRRVIYRYEPRVGTPLIEGLRDLKNKTSPSPLSSLSSAQATPSTTPTPEPVNHGIMTNPLLNPKSKPKPDQSPSYFPLHLLHRSLITGPQLTPVLEHTTTEDGWPHTLSDRASWALELELSMRGAGFTWTTADVRHTRRTWLPTVPSRLHSIFLHALPTLLVSLAGVRAIYLRYSLADVDEVLWAAAQRNEEAGRWDIDYDDNLFGTRLPLLTQLTLTLCLGATLLAAFSLAHSIFAVVCSPLAPGPLAYFPPLYTKAPWEIRGGGLREFWSYGWHRLFARFFLVYGIWPGEWLERKLLGKTAQEPADVGKVLGGFLSSAFCHGFAARGVSGGNWWLARGEVVFFAMNGVAVVVEEVVRRVVVRRRMRRKGESLERWWDGWVGRVWWISVVLLSGRNFARGWVNAGLVREMSGL